MQSSFEINLKEKVENFKKQFEDATKQALVESRDVKII
jgi:hypothetical protein